MDRSIAEMAAAVLWINENEARIIEALAHQAALQGLPPNGQESRDRLSVLIDLGIFLGRLVSHGAAVDSLLRVDALADFPTFSADTTKIDVGSIALLRARVEDVYDGELRVKIEAEGLLTHSVPIRRAAVVGVEKAPTR